MNHSQPTVGRLLSNICQLGYVTTDIERATDYFRRSMDIPEFVVDEDPDLVNTRYRGEPAEWDSVVAQGMAGDMNVEVIEPVSEEYNIFWEGLDEDGFDIDLHHYAVDVGTDPDAYDRALEQLESAGISFVISGEAPGLGKFTYLDLVQELGHYIEVCYFPEEAREFFEELAQEPEG